MVVVAEPERDAIIAATSGHTLIGPGSIPWEIGNAFMDNVAGVGSVPDKTPKAASITGLKHKP